MNDYNVPCSECIAFAMCKTRIDGSVTHLATTEECPQAIKFINETNQNGINKMRKLFGLKEYK